MAVRLQEIHPAVVHFPIVLLPIAVGADLVGRLADHEGLREAGRQLMPAVAASAAVSAVSGLIAQEEVEAGGRAKDILVTHRTINLAVAATSLAMATWRWRRRRPTAGYLGLGLAAIGLVGYTAYLGSKMVYEYGVGVDAAGGIRPGGGAPLSRGHAAAALRTAAGDMARGLPHAVSDAARGQILPAWHGAGDRPGRGSAEGPAPRVERSERR